MHSEPEVSLRSELEVAADRCQQFERRIDGLLTENAALEAKQAQLREILTIALGIGDNDSTHSRTIVSQALQSDPEKTAAILAQAIAPLMNNQILHAVAQLPLVYDETLRLNTIRLEAQAIEPPRLNRSPPQLPYPDSSDFIFDRFKKFTPSDTTSYAAIDLHSNMTWNRWVAYSSCRLAFAIKLTGYRKFAVQYRASTPMERNRAVIDTHDWSICEQSPDESGAVDLHSADAGNGWRFAAIELPLDGGNYPILSIIPKHVYNHPVLADSALPFVEIGMVSVHFGWEDGQRDMSLALPDSVNADDNRARADTGNLMPAVPILKGKKLSATATARAQNERQCHVDGFLADGEYSRIAALKDVHRGKRAFIIGNGPSLAQHDLSQLAGEISFVANWFANHPDFDALRPTYYAISSHEMFGGWRNENPALNEEFTQKLMAHSHRPEMFFSHRFKQIVEADPRFENYPTRYLIFDQPKFLADEVGGLQYDLSLPMNDGYTVLLTFCMPLALHMGIEEIYLLGCDCDYGITSETDEGPRKYFYPAEQHATSSTKASSIVRIWANNGPIFRVYEQTRNQLARCNVKLCNATPEGRLNVLPRVSLNDLLRQTPDGNANTDQADTNQTGTDQAAKQPGTPAATEKGMNSDKP